MLPDPPLSNQDNNYAQIYSSTHVQYTQMFKYTK